MNCLHSFIIIEAPVLQDNLLVRIEENSENVPVDLRQEPAAFPEPTIFNWYRDGELLTTRADRRLTYTLSGGKMLGTTLYLLPTLS